MLNTGVINDTDLSANKSKTSVPSLAEHFGAMRFPKTVFHSWAGFSPITVPASAKVYNLKQIYSIEDVRSFAQKLSTLGNVKEYKNHVLSYKFNLKEEAASLLIIDKNSGEFFYNSTDGIPLSQKKVSLNEKIYDFLYSVDWQDPTINVIASYRLKSQPDMTYVELKRNWDSAGLPILNPVGLLNLQENERISGLELNDSGASLARNTNIYDTTDNKDGLERNTDFNTMTIGISDITNRIILIKSNLRKLDAVKTSDTGLIAYDEAVSRLKKNIQSFVLTTPAKAATSAEWKKIFPNNLAESQQAIVDESVLVYLEQPPGVQQSSLEPYYVFRGSARLMNNYQTAFIAAVPAAKQSLSKSINPDAFSLFPKVYAANGDIGQIGGQKQGAFELTITPPDPPTPTASYASCIPAEQDLNPIRIMNSGTGRIGYGWSPVAIINGIQRMSTKGWWYFIPAEGTTDANLRNDLNQVLVQIQQTTGRRDFRNFNTGVPPNILSDFQATGTTCPIRVTGDSPTIFVYAPNQSKMTIQPPAHVRYAQPFLSGELWNITSNGGGSVRVNNADYDFLYYEYSGVQFSRPDKGWNIKKNDIHNFAQKTIRPLLLLHSRETERLEYELHHAADKIADDTIFIGIVDRNELDKKLQMTVSPQAELNRFFFYVGEKKDEVEAPRVSPIVRTDYLIVELGSYAGNK